MRPWLDMRWKVVARSSDDSYVFKKVSKSLMIAWYSSASIDAIPDAALALASCSRYISVNHVHRIVFCVFSCATIRGAGNSNFRV